MNAPAEKSELVSSSPAVDEKHRKILEENERQRERLQQQDQRIKEQGRKSHEQRDKLAELKERNRDLKEKFEEQRVTLEMMKLSASSNDEAGEIARKIRKARKRALLLRFFLGVVLPTLLGVAYYGFLASDRFESTALFNIQAVDNRQSASMDSLFGVLPGASATGRDTLTVRDFILSREVLERLNNDHGFVAHYKNPAHDIISRMNADATMEDAFDYYQDVVRLDYDSISGVLTLTVTAYTAEAAQKFSEAILHYSEDAVNKLSERSRDDQTIFARKEVKLSEDRLENARKEVLKLQAERGEFSPESSASEALSVRHNLEVTLANSRAELMGARAYMSETAPQVIALQQKVNALAAQIKQESRRLVAPNEADGLNASMAEFESAIFEKELAQAGYQSAVASLEIARQDAARQHRYLVRIARPSLADESTTPNRPLGMFTVFIASILLLGIGTLLNASIREHAKV